MKITIDTKEDSSEDIRKVIALLSHLIEDRGGHSNIFEDGSPVLGTGAESASGNAFTNMFGSDSPSLPSSLNEPDKGSKESEEPEEIPQIIEY